ncbi:retrotransposon protein, putative, ty1-copia subclass [Tanacetum coccineum]
MVLGIAPAAIIDRQLPFEYTITSRSTDVVVMAQPVQNINHSAFRSMFEREKLSGNNFNDWFRQLKLVLRVEKKMFVIEQPLPAAPAADSNAQVLAEWNALYDAYNEVACLMLGSMTPELHRQFENYSPYEMLQELKSMFEKQAGVERFDLIQTFHACKQEEGKPVAAYVLQMKGYVDQLERLGYMLPQDLIVGLILNGLTKDFAGFVRNYNMHNMGKTIGELHAMLIEYEKVYIPKLKTLDHSAKEHPAKDDTCNHCKEVGHWKRNCHVYLAELLKKKKQVGSTRSSGIFIIELFAFPNKSWVYDTSCGTHICITKQGFREARKLKQGALYLYVGNSVRAQVEAIRSYDLVLFNGLVICLDNCHYAPSITRGLVLVHRLVENRFVQCFTDFGILVSKNNVHYFNAIPSNGIYEIDMHDLVPNVNSIYNVSTKRAKHNLDSTYLWHCLLAHINMCQDKVFETFKVFKNEVENQLGKTIKALQSDQGGEYISQEFKDFLKACGIVQQLTPPYTPQHNDVSERRNHTLLDMVRSMMNLTTLSLSFWDYALESATRILNMVPTKKVDKTPYELWYGKVPNLSYLKVWGYEARVNRGFEPPQEEVILIRRSKRTHQAPNSLCLNVEAEEHSLGDLNEPTSYKAAMLDSDLINEVDFYEKDSMDWLLYTPISSYCSVGGGVKGYTQLYGVDYEETFSPVADTRAIRILISIAAFYDYEIWQMDVKTAFLNGYLDEDIYMVQPEGFVNPSFPEKYRKLQRSILWFLSKHQERNKIDEEIKRFGFDQNLDDPCVYQKASGSNVTFLILYVDDIIIMRNHIPSLQSVKDYLGKCFAMKDLGEAAFILGIKIYRDRLDLNKTQGASTPKEVKHMQNVPYASAVGSIMYVTDRDDTKSQTRYVFILNGGAVDWKSSKQSTTTMSTTESEYIAASEAAIEAIWIRKFISGLGIVPTINEPIRMFCDNSAVLHFANEPGVQKGARHYHRRYHYVHESIALGEIRFLKVHTDDNLAGPFMKALSKGQLTQHARSMRLHLASSFM